MRPTTHPLPTPLGTPVPGWRDRLMRWWFTSRVPGIASRHVTVLVPAGYGEQRRRRYPALYLNDGAACLDRDDFGHGGWQVHAIADDLVRRGLMAPAIIVLVDNGGEARTEEFFPGAGAPPGPSADAYLDFLEQQVIPFVDSEYLTLASRVHRAIGGSSYGGTISLWAGWTRTATWGRVLSMSPSLFRDVGDAAPESLDLEGLVTGKLPLRVYLDSGTSFEGGPDGGDDGLARTSALVELLVSRGWALHRDLEHVVAEGHEHTEAHWRARLRPATRADETLGPEPRWPGALPFVFPPG